MIPEFLILSERENAVYYYNRGISYSKLKNYEKAIDDFSESIRLKPDHFKSFLMRGFAYLFSGKLDKAKADFDTYLQNKRLLKNILP
jgi:tetratricopeptide (TPR) repeat protein